MASIQTLRASAAQTSGTVTGEAGAGLIDLGSIIRFEDFHELVAQLDVTAAATEVDDTLDVYIDTTFDGGTKWVNIGHFTQVLGNGGAKTFALVIKNDNPGATAVFNLSTDAAAGATRQIGFGSQIRYRGVVVDAGGTAASFTYSVKAHLKK